MISFRTAVLLAGVTLASLSFPVRAQPAPPPPPGAFDGGGWRGSWQGQWQGPENRVYNGTWSGTFERGSADRSDAQIDGPQPHPRDERYQRMVERCSSDHRGGKVIGGVIGGVVGGVVGNRLADGNRALGTVVGAGAGALGGAAVGSAIDSAHDRECDEFFRSAGPGWTTPGGQGWGPAPGYMWVPVVSFRGGGAGGRGYTETVTTTEEFIDEGRATRHRVIRKHHAPRRVIHDKRVYIGGS